MYALYILDGWIDGWKVERKVFKVLEFRIEDRKRLYCGIIKSKRHT